MQTTIKYKLPYHQNTKDYQLHKNISTLTRITCPTEEVSSYVLLPWDVFHSKGVFLDCYCTPKHSVVLVHCIL